MVAVAVAMNRTGQTLGVSFCLAFLTLLITAWTCSRRDSELCTEGEAGVLFVVLTEINPWLPGPLRQGYTKPVWPKWQPQGGDALTCSTDAADWRGGRFLSTVNLLSFEHARLGRNITVYELGCGSCASCCRLNSVPGIRRIGVDIAAVKATLSMI